MAVANCALDEAEGREQLARYRRLGELACGVQRSDLELTVAFGTDVDAALLGLLARTIEVERRCCPFFRLDYAAAERRLTIAVADPVRRSALDAIASALAPVAV